MIRSSTMRVAILLFIIFLPNLSFAEKYISKHVYIMGDNDTKNEARKLCLMEAKRKIVEQAGTYISSRTEITNMELSSDEIMAFSASVLKSKIVNERWFFQGTNLALELTVEATVDSEAFTRRVNEMGKSDDLLNKIQEQYERVRTLEDQIAAIQSKLNQTDLINASDLRNKRIYAISEIDSIEERYGEILGVVKNRRIKIQKQSIELGRQILNYIEVDMTMDEVESLLGKPDKVGSALFDKELRHFEYNQYIIYFTKNGFVKEIGYRTKGGNLTPALKKYGYNILSDGLTDLHKRDPLTAKELKEYVIGTTN